MVTSNRELLERRAIVENLINAAERDDVAGMRKAWSVYIVYKNTENYNDNFAANLVLNYASFDCLKFLVEKNLFNIEPVNYFEKIINEYILAIDEEKKERYLTFIDFIVKKFELNLDTIIMERSGTYPLPAIVYGAGYPELIRLFLNLGASVNMQIRVLVNGETLQMPVSEAIESLFNKSYSPGVAQSLEILENFKIVKDEQIKLEKLLPINGDDLSQKKNKV